MKVLLIGADGKMGKEMSKYFDESGTKYFKIDKDNRHLAKKLDFDVILDFSTADALCDNLKLALGRKCPIIVATTGHSQKNQQLITEYSKHIAVFLSANFSILFTVFRKFLKAIKNIDGMEVVVNEVHHKTKKDKPSGSAKELIKLLNSKNIIPKVYVLRVGDVVGEHGVEFYSKDEKLEIKHTAQSKQVFCHGAYLACKFMANKKSGLYGMEDIF